MLFRSQVPPLPSSLPALLRCQWKSPTLGGLWLSQSLRLRFWECELEEERAHPFRVCGRAVRREGLGKQEKNGPVEPWACWARPRTCFQAVIALYLGGSFILSERRVASWTMFIWWAGRTTGSVVFLKAFWTPESL